MPSVTNMITNKLNSTMPSVQPQANSVSIGDMINSESETNRNNKIKDQIDKLVEKHNVRLNLAKGKISSGNKNADKLENARSSLSDYARSKYIEEAEKDKSIDLSVLDKMKDQDIIDWMIKDDPIAEKEYINYVNNGGFVKDAYNKIMGIDEEALKEQERQNAGWLANFGGAFVSELPRQVGGLIDISGNAADYINKKTSQAADYLNKNLGTNLSGTNLIGITDYFNKKDKERLDKYNQVSNEEYDKFKKGEISFDELKKKGVSGIYLDYENDVENGTFRGSLEDYAKAIYDSKVGDLGKSIQQQMDEDFLWSYNPEGKGAGLGKFIPQMVEFAMLPGAKGNFLRNTLLGTAEILGINSLSEGELPTAGEAGATAVVTAGIEGLLRIPGGYKLLRSFVGNVSPELREALGNTTKSQWKKWADVVKKGFGETKKEATSILNKASTGIKEKLNEAGKKLGEIRKDMEGDFKFQDFFDSINAEFKKFEEKGWGPNSAPEIKIDKAGNMSIYNEEALSNVTDTNGIKLLDYIKSEWNAFRNQARADDIKNAERFMQDINDKIWRAINEGKISRGDSAVLALLDAVKGGYEKLYGKMGALGQDFKAAREEFSNMDSYANFFEKYIGKIKEGKKGTQALNELEKEMSLGEKGFGKGGDYIGEFLKILKDNDIVKEDLASQLMSLVYSFGIKNPKQMQELIETIYPSIPGIREIGLSLGRKGMKEAEAKSLLKDATPQLSDIFQTISNIVRPAAQVGEENLLDY